MCVPRWKEPTQILASSRLKPPCQPNTIRKHNSSELTTITYGAQRGYLNVYYKSMNHLWFVCGKVNDRVALQSNYTFRRFLIFEHISIVLHSVMCWIANNFFIFLFAWSSFKWVLWIDFLYWDFSVQGIFGDNN